ncbi:MAG: M23 family metallopeptidase [Chloroflexota bacterium]|nr:M23 family metallopeptidase [Chloroflexota bacterium]
MSAALPLAVVVIVVAASVLSWLPGAASGGPVGGPQGDGPGVRKALAGVFGSGQGGTDGTGPTDGGTVSGPGPAAPATVDRLASNRFHPVAVDAVDRSTITPAAAVSQPFLSDGTLVKPIAVNTSIADGSALLTTYKVRAGDSLTGIANRFGVSMMTVMWANNLKTAAAVHTGQVLTIPPVNGVVLSVHEGDTLASIAASYSVPADKIYRLNGLQDTALVVGQTLILPGAVETAPVAPRTIAKLTPRISRPVTGPGSNPVGTPPGPVVPPPAHYAGGKFAWPVVGGNNYISQYFHSGHYAIDIAGDYGSKVVAAADGIVTFAGWKNNGGGYQVWIAHGDNLFTTYNHMSAITVGTGETVARGDQVGRTGQSGNATGPHLHFEVWRGPIWNGGTRVNPLLYL